MASQKPKVAGGTLPGHFGAGKLGQNVALPREVSMDVLQSWLPYTDYNNDFNIVHCCDEVS